MGPAHFTQMQPLSKCERTCAGNVVLDVPSVNLGSMHKFSEMYIAGFAGRNAGDSVPYMVSSAAF